MTGQCDRLTFRLPGLAVGTTSFSGGIAASWPAGRIKLGLGPEIKVARASKHDRITHNSLRWPWAENHLGLWGSGCEKVGAVELL